MKNSKLNKLMLCIAALNVGTMRGRGSEVVEMLGRRGVEICCVQETRWNGGSARLLSAKDYKYKFFWSGDKSGLGGVGVLLHIKLVDNVISVLRLDHRIMQLRILLGKTIMNVFCVYGPQVGLPEETQDLFYNNLLNNISKVPSDEFLIICGDLNGHVGKLSTGFDNIHGGHGFGNLNREGTRILDLCAAANLAVANTFFK